MYHWQRGKAGATLFVGQYFRVSDAGVVVDGQVQVLPTDPAALDLAIAGDAVADLLETTQLFDIDMDDLAGVLPLIAAHRFGWLQCRELVDAEPSQDAADGRRRHVDLDRNLLARVALAAQSLNDRACRRRCLGTPRARKPTSAESRN
jgi:hypothetical protein